MSTATARPTSSSALRRSNRRSGVFNGKPVGGAAGVPALLFGLTPLGSNLPVGINVAAEDVNNDGHADIISALGRTSRPSTSSAVPIRSDRPCSASSSSRRPTGQARRPRGAEPRRRPQEPPAGSTTTGLSGPSTIIIGAGAQIHGPQADVWNVLPEQRLLNTANFYDTLFAGGVWVAAGGV